MRLSIGKTLRNGSRAALALGGIGLGALLLSGCTHEDSTSSGGAGSKTSTSAANGGTNTTTGAKKKIVFVFKIGGISYSEACKAGAEQANNDPEINADVQYQAATEGTAEKQKDIIEQAIVGHADAIVVSPVDSKAIIPSLQKAKEKGIQVYTWDSDSPDSPREFYVAALDDVQIGVDIAEALAKSINEKGTVLLFSGQPTAENLNKHLDGLKQGLAKFPGIKIALPVYYNDDKTDKAKQTAVTALQAHPDAVGIGCTNSVSPRGAGEALRTLNKIGAVKVWGLGLPSENKPYLKDNSVTGLYLWDPQKLTYLTAKLVKNALDGKAPQDGQTIPEGTIHVKGAQVTLPLRLEINKTNVDSMKF
jgi:rhamnose transport system substrate-binding protein